MSTNLPIQEAPAAAKLQGSAHKDEEWNAAVMNNYLRNIGIVSFDSSGIKIPDEGSGPGLGTARGSRGRSALKLTSVIEAGVSEAKKFLSHNYGMIVKL